MSAALRAMLVCLCAAALLPGQTTPRRFVHAGADGKLVYAADERGDRVPDFSHAGYGGGGVAIPDAPVRVVVAAKPGDAGPRIQAAIDHVAALPPGRDGLRGAVLLLAGKHEVAGCLRISAGGVVLRGQGSGPKCTVVVATGTDRRTLIQIKGKSDLQYSSKVYAVADRYVPVGAARLKLDRAGLRVGDAVQIVHPATKKWVAALGMDRFATDGKGSWLDWRPGTLDVRFDRVVTAVDGDAVTLDAPLTMALDAALSSCKVVPYTWPGRIAHVGVEDLRCESDHDRGNALDEQHAWNAVGVEAAQNVWVRRVTAAHFAGSAVYLADGAKWVTVEDCASVRPVSEVAGYRRHTFYTAGQLTLFRRCKAERGRHDFATGYLAAGPNAFVECRAEEAHHFSGPIESWATGALYDNVAIDGGGLALTNRENDAHGAGWAAANCVLWQCSAPVVTCRRPPGARNWAIGCWGQFVGDGHWHAMNQFVKPQCLYDAQLAERLGAKAVEAVKPRTVSTQPGDAKAVEEIAPERIRKLSHPPSHPTRPLALKSGWLVCDGKLLAGGRTGTAWWRGHALPARAGEVGVGVTRFLPGRSGPGATDDLDELAAQLRAGNKAILSHHWGLWYDRRRDDHQMVRRADAEAWPPFYEQPWARSGQGRAWDGLSKYDLARFNPWYFARLKAFADACDREGLLLVQQMYFQHNLLEAGAHWADFPWRPANCVQATGFPEPPPYAGGKRVFMAEAFYDVRHPVRRQLHRAYIRHCLDALGKNSNVLFLTGEEYTGPLAFVRFWLDTVAEWEKENRRKVHVGLSATKDVQDAILSDPERGPRISVIDLKYWWYTSDGAVYAPKGGESLAPRQQLRAWKGSRSRSDAAVARQVREYRNKYPDKAILCSIEPARGWAVVAAGGSVPDLPPRTDAKLLAALPRMRPFDVKGLTARQWALAEEGRNYLVASLGGDPIAIELPAGDWAAYRVDPRTGAPGPAADLRGGAAARFDAAILWVTRKG